MNLNYKILSTNKKSKTGICYILNVDNHVLTECVFNISRIKLENKYHRTVIFTSWTHNTFDGSAKELEKFIFDSLNDNILVMCIYNHDIHSNVIQKDIKEDVSKRILEFTKVT